MKGRYVGKETPLGTESSRDAHARHLDHYDTILARSIKEWAHRY